MQFLHPVLRTKISHKDNNSQLSINIIRTTSKTYKMLKKKSARRSKEISRQDRLFSIPSFLDFISRFRHPLARCSSTSFCIKILKHKKVYYFAFYKKIFLVKNILSKPEAADWATKFDYEHKFDLFFVIILNRFFISKVIFGRSKRQQHRISRHFQANGRRGILAYFHSHKKKVNFHTYTNSFMLCCCCRFSQPFISPRWTICDFIDSHLSGVN